MSKKVVSLCNKLIKTGAGTRIAPVNVDLKIKRADVSTFLDN
jgi:hypothetical protein